MTNKLTLTPPPELLGKWEEDWHHAKVKDTDLEDHIAIQAARWGADQELEACKQWLALQNHAGLAIELGLCMRNKPKPPTLKEQALIELGDVYNRDKIDDVTYDTIRRALEALDD